MELQKIKDIIEEVEKQYNFNDYILNYTSDEKLSEVSNTDELRELFETLNENCEITDTEVIYYSSAIDYLRENDQSLTESLELAKDMGYTLDKLSSEVLASILKSENNRIDYQEFITEVIEKVEQLQDSQF